MKIRSGFVSNSSSSSFIVAFNKVPRTLGETVDMLFNEKTAFGGTYSSSPTYPVSEIAAIVLNDIQSSKPASNKKIVDTILSGWSEDIPDLDDFKIDNQKTDWDGYHKRADKWAEAKAKKFIEENEGCTFYIFSYSDNDSQMFCEMEHGNLFGRLPHLTISCH